MESFAKSDAFFFITTICVFIVTALLVMILVEVLRIIKNVRHITDHLHSEAKNLASDFATFRAMLMDNQFGFKPIFDGMKKAGSVFSKGKPKKTTRPASAKGYGEAMKKKEESKQENESI